MSKHFDVLQNLVYDLEKKKTKKASKQLDNIRRYFDDEGVELKEKPEEFKKNEKPFAIFYYDNVYKPIKSRPICDDGNLILSKQPLMLFIKLYKAFEHYLLPQLKEFEKDSPQCLAWPSLKYNAVNHGLIMSCEFCWYAFKGDGLFCEKMIKTLKENGYGLSPELTNPIWTLRSNYGISKRGSEEQYRG